MLIKFVSMGEKPDSLEVFHPDQATHPFFGMGKCYSIVEKAQQAADEKQVEDAERMLRKVFTMDDLLNSDESNPQEMGGLARWCSTWQTKMAQQAVWMIVLWERQLSFIR